jgi:hypothetical protein
VSSTPFSLLGASSPIADVATPSHRITLPSYGAKTSSLPPLHLPATLHLVASPLELKPKHWICTTTVGHPLCITQLPPSTTIKMSSQPWSLSLSLNYVSLARAPHHQSSIHRHHSLSPSSHAHRPSTQRDPWWWTSRPSFTFRIIHRHVSSHKKIF